MLTTTMGTAPRLSRTARGAAVGACVVIAVVTVAGCITAVHVSGQRALEGHVYEDTVTALVWSALGALLLVKAPRNAFGPLFLVVSASACLSLVLSAAGTLYAGQGAAVACAWVAGWAWTPGTFLPVTLVPLWFPDGPPQRGDRRGRWLSVAAVGALVALTVGLAGAKTVDVTPTSSVPGPLAFPASDVLFLVGSAAVVLVAGVSVGLLLRRLIAAEGERRRQLAPVAIALCVAVPCLLAAGLLPAKAALIQIVVLPLVPAAVALAVLRYRLFDVEIVIRRSVVLLGLTALVVTGYAVVVQLTAALLRRRAGLPESLVATGVVALAFQPARSMLQGLVGRWLYGERERPLDVLTGVGERLAGAADPVVALEETTTQLRRSLRLPWVAVHGASGQLVTTGSRPVWLSDDRVDRIPLVHLGVVHGQLLVGPRGQSDSLSAADRRLLDDVAAPVAAVVAAGHLVAELRRARESVVLAREEERRRLRHDLHDGLGPVLSAIVTHADVASLRLRRDPASAAVVVDRVGRLSADAVAGLRRVVEDLRPPALDELGLVPALRQLADSFMPPGHDGQAMAESGPRTAVEIRNRLQEATLAAMPAAVEIAVYRIAAEAVRNAVVHGRALKVQIDLEATDRALLLRVSDDGSGFDPRAAATSSGLGLRSMRSRAAELGGHVRVSARAGRGTVLESSLPLHWSAHEGDPCPIS
jgi:two-component system, NarL family, sensor kinase